MKYGKEYFKKGKWTYPRINGTAECAVCEKDKAFVLSNKGMVCGKCFLELQKTDEDTIILEAAKILKKRGN